MQCLNFSGELSIQDRPPIALPYDVGQQVPDGEVDSSSEQTSFGETDTQASRPENRVGSNFSCESRKALRGATSTAMCLEGRGPAREPLPGPSPSPAPSPCLEISKTPKASGPQLPFSCVEGPTYFKKICNRFVSNLPTLEPRCHRIQYFCILVETTDVSTPAPPPSTPPPHQSGPLSTHVTVAEWMPNPATGYLQNNFHLPRSHVLQGRR